MSPDEPTPQDFHTTHWSLVIAAGRGGDEALESLCRRYWLPLYAFVRRRTADMHQAQDLTQDFFVQLLDKHTLARASAERGRFRAFLLTSLKHFLANARERERAEKRGGGRTRWSLDFDAGESRLSLEPAFDVSPERLFDRQWALALLDGVMQRLAAEYHTSGKGPLFEELKETIAGGAERVPYAELAMNLGASEESLRQAAHRMRKRYRQLLREEVAHTVDRPDEVDDEIRSLFTALGAGPG